MHQRLSTTQVSRFNPHPIFSALNHNHFKSGISTSFYSDPSFYTHSKPLFFKRSLPYFTFDKEEKKTNHKQNDIRIRAVKDIKSFFKKDYLKFIFDNALEPIFIQANWKFQYINKAGLELFGAKNLKELKGTLVIDRIHPDYKSQVTQRIKGLNEKRKKQNSVELIVFKLDGTPLFVETIGIPFEFDGINGAIVFIRDNTEIKKTIKELKDSNLKGNTIDDLKYSLLQNLSHEIRTPLNSIQGFADLLGIPGLPQEKHAEFLINLQNGIKDISDLIFKSISLSLLDSNLEQLTLKPISLDTIVDDLTGHFSQLLKQKNINFKVIKPKDEFKLIADGEKLYKVLHHLIENAIKFTNEGTIILEFRINDSNILFSVRDTGPGIPQEFKSLVFDRFFQVENPMTKSHSGVGLGLAICKALVELMEGKIWIESDFGNGTSAYFTIPYFPVS
jgi:PAS domain S-box-containing protein